MEGVVRTWRLKLFCRLGVGSFKTAAGDMVTLPVSRSEGGVAWGKGGAIETAILSFRGRPFFLFSTTSPPSIISSALRLVKDRFLLMLAVLSSLSLLDSSLDFRVETLSFNLLPHTFNMFD